MTEDVARIDGSGLIAAIDRRLRRLSLSRSSKAIRRHASILGASHEETQVLIGLALTEMTARPLDARIVEWCVVLPARSGFLGKATKRLAGERTVGPFQMLNAPLDLKAAVAVALIRLRRSGVDVRDTGQLARLWHGPASGRMAAVSYARVLKSALEIASD